ncbi:MAG: DUF2344 domain-containing protein [Dehalococcoidia bacterium]|nr:DUF2344 domain-containing protein [Dehalococcoidia bacterium]
MYRRTGDACALTSGELTRAWAEACVAARLPLVPAGGGRHRIELGPPLPPETTGERELLDLWLAGYADPERACAALCAALPTALAPVSVEDIGERLPSLSASVRWAEYELALPAAAAPALREQVAAFLARQALPWEERRGERTRRIDLRAAVLALELLPAAEGDACARLRMRITLEPGRGARPASVLAALGVAALAVPGTLVRTAIEAARPRVALRAWRTRGRFE